MLELFRVLLALGWIIVIACSLIGASQLYLAALSTSAPAQAAAAGVALGYAVIPYVIVRAVELMFKPWPSRVVVETKVPPSDDDLRRAVEAELNRRFAARSDPGASPEKSQSR